MGEELFDCSLIGGDVHQIEHGLEACEVTGLAAATEGKQGLVVTEELMTSEAADLIGLANGTTRGLFVQ